MLHNMLDKMLREMLRNEMDALTNKTFGWGGRPVLGQVRSSHCQIPAPPPPPSQKLINPPPPRPGVRQLTKRLLCTQRIHLVSWLLDSHNISLPLFCPLYIVIAICHLWLLFPFNFRGSKSQRENRQQKGGQGNLNPSAAEMDRRPCKKMRMHQNQK